MAVIAVLLLVAGATTLLVLLALRRWPEADPSERNVGMSAVRRHLGGARARLHPVETTGAALGLVGAAVAVGAAAVGILFFMVRTETGLGAFDLRLAEWSADHATDASTEVLKTVTTFGATSTVVALLVAVAIVEYARIPSREAIVFLAAVGLGQWALVNLVKVIVDRARPDVDPLAGFAGASFPSGHSATAAAGLAAIALLLGRGRARPVRMWLLAAAAGIAAAVAATRVMLGVHWLTDVVAGLALGWAWFAACAVAFGGRRLHFGAPVEGVPPPR
jgi:undecaprenyl-diphosphatase